MLDSEYLNDWWHRVNAENPEEVPAEDMKKVLAELAQYRGQHVPDAEQLRDDTITVERCLSQTSMLVNASRDVAMMVGAIPSEVKAGEPDPTVPMNSSVTEAQEAIARIYVHFNRMIET